MRHGEVSLRLHDHKRMQAGKRRVRGQRSEVKKIKIHQSSIINKSSFPSWHRDFDIRDFRHYDLTNSQHASCKTYSFPCPLLPPHERTL